jgi:chromosome segregation ATPase
MADDIVQLSHKITESFNALSYAEGNIRTYEREIAGRQKAIDEYKVSLEEQRRLAQSYRDKIRETKDQMLEVLSKEKEKEGTANGADIDRVSDFDSRTEDHVVPSESVAKDRIEAIFDTLENALSSVPGLRETVTPGLLRTHVLRNLSKQYQKAKDDDEIPF